MGAQNTNRRTLLGLAAVAPVLAATGCGAKVTSARREADPEAFDTFERLNQDGVIVIDMRSPGHPTKQEVGFGKLNNIGGIEAPHGATSFPVKVLLPLGEVMIRCDGSVLSQLAYHAPRDSPPVDVTINSHFKSPQDAADWLTEDAAHALGIDPWYFGVEPGLTGSGGGQTTGFRTSNVIGYRDDNLSIDVGFVSSDEPGKFTANFNFYPNGGPWQRDSAEPESTAVDNVTAPEGRR